MTHIQILRWFVAVPLLWVCISSCKSQGKQTGSGPLTHVVIKDTAYYVDGPQQARPEDGTLTVGTEVRLVESGSSYSLIDKPVHAWVFTGDLRSLE